MTDRLRDIRQALRSLLRAPSFLLLTVLPLGLAIGVNAGIFNVIDKVLLEPLPFEDSDQLVVIGGSAPGSDLPDEFPLSLEFLVHYREHSELLDGIAGFNAFTNTLRVDDRVERVPMSAPSTSIFHVLGADPILGRLPTDEDESNGILISHALWANWFGSDPDVLERTVYAGGRDRIILGVMGPDFWFPSDETLLWIPQVPQTEDIQPGRFGQPFVARVADGADREALLAELGTLARQLPERFGGSANYAEVIEKFQPIVRPLEEQLLGDVATPLWILLGSMALVLLIACANVANLFMVRAERRLPDLAVRRALGAARGRLIGSQLAEAIIIATLAGLLAVGLTWVGVPLLLSVAPANLPRLGDVSLSGGTLLFTFVACVVSALLCGLIPAWRFSRPRLDTLREGGRGGSRRRGWGRNALVVAQTALALVLLIGSALLLRSFDKLRNVDPGYDTQDIFTFQIAPEGSNLTDAVSYARFHMDFMDRVAALPGVERVGIVENVPLDEGVSQGRFRTPDMPDVEDGGTLLSYTWSAGDYFRTMNIEVLQGRAFTTADHTTQLGNILVSRSAADLLWPGQDPIGQRLQPQGLGTWETVVGVVDDVLQYEFRRDAEPMVYFPLVGQDPENRRTVSSPAYVVKTARADTIAPEIRELVREVSPFAPMYRMYTMDSLASRAMAQLSFTTLTLGIASVLALILGVVGLYGVLSYAVAERTREIGLRMALGAAAGRVRRMIVGQGARVLALGIAIGLAIALLASQALSSLLFGIETFDLLTYGAVAGIMVLVGLAASYLPARRASKVDPMEALRSE